MIVRYRIGVPGRVQRVSFRANTRRKANALGVAGSAINLPDGTVEVVVQGEQAAVEQLLEWLHHGPRFARVDNVTWVEECVDADQTDSFTQG